MAKKVEIKKTVFDRKAYSGAISNKFKFFKEPEPVVDPDTIQELFRLYDKLYVTIPIEGEEQSHQYLVERSSELYKIDTQLDNIQPLLDEVASLRGQILESNRRILELETQLAGGGELDFASAEQMELLRTQLETANATIATLENANRLANMATEQASQAATEAAEKAKEAAEQAAQQAAAQQAAQGSSQAIDEIVAELNDKKSAIGAGRRIIENRMYLWIKRLSRYTQKYYWLYADNRDIVNRPWYDRRRAHGSGWNAGRAFLIPSNENQMDDMTLDFIVAELEQGGYKATEIVQAIEKIGNFKGKVKVRVITYKDPDKEDKVGYRLVK